MLRALFALAALFALPAYAALPPGDSTANPASGPTITAKVTCYGPGYDPAMEGPFATSKPRPASDGERGSIPRTLDDFRLGKSKYVTLAAHPMHYGKWYHMGTIKYVSNLDGREYTIQDVVGYVHDTGCAFDGRCCAKYNTCGVMHRKFDIAYGDYRRGGNIGLVNKSPFCGNVDTVWRQIGGPLTTDPVVTAGAQVEDPEKRLAAANRNIFSPPASPSAFTGFPSQNTGSPAANTGSGAGNTGSAAGNTGGSAPGQSGAIQPGQYFSPASAAQAAAPYGAASAGAPTPQSVSSLLSGSSLTSPYQPSSAADSILQSIKVAEESGERPSPLTLFDDKVFKDFSNAFAAANAASTTSSTTVSVTPLGRPFGAPATLAQNTFQSLDLQIKKIVPLSPATVSLSRILDAITNRLIGILNALRGR